MTVELKDTNAGKESNYTYPSGRPKLRLNYIFVSKEIKVLEAESKSIDVSASDHLPYNAVIEI